MYPVRAVRAGVTAALLLGSMLVQAEAGNGPSVAELAKEDQNPITRLYVMRFEDNAQMGFGPDNQVVNFFRIQPLVPFHLNEDWTLLTRLVIPIAHQPWPESTDGLSDIALGMILTPVRGGRFTWGAGPALLLPTATDDAIGTEKWSAGPVVSGIYTQGHWLVGALIQNLWSFAGDDDRRDVNTMVLRPLLNYTLPNGWYLTSSPSIAANWKADTGDRWLVPLGGGVGRVFAIGKQRMSTTVEFYYHAESPKIGPDWQLRVQFSLLYPD